MNCTHLKGFVCWQRTFDVQNPHNTKAGKMLSLNLPLDVTANLAHTFVQNMLLLHYHLPECQK